MGRKIRAIDATTGKMIWVDADKLKTGPIRNAALSGPLLQRIRTVHARIRGAYPVTLEQFEVEFMRERDPENEVAFWERLSLAMEKVCAAAPELERKLVLHTLLARSMHALTEQERNHPAVQRVIAIADSDSGRA